VGFGPLLHRRQVCARFTANFKRPSLLSTPRPSPSATPSSASKKGRTRAFDEFVTPAFQAEAPVLWCSHPVFGPP
jgi:hypothetical protein